MSKGNDRNRVRWIGDFYHGGKTGCRIQIKTVTLRDNGDWSCEMTYWPHDSQGKTQFMLHSKIGRFACNLTNSQNCRFVSILLKLTELDQLSHFRLSDIFWDSISIGNQPNGVWPF